MSSRALTGAPSPRLTELGPRILGNVVGGILELVIQVVEDLRDRRDRGDR